MWFFVFSPYQSFVFTFTKMLKKRQAVCENIQEKWEIQ